MLVLEPSEPLIREFLASQKAQSFSYAAVGASRDGSPSGYDVDHNQALLGTGEAVFERACESLRRWQMFPRPWTRVEPSGAPIQEGVEVAVLFRVFGLWWLNASRILAVFDETEPVRCQGFVYGTLPDHIESGEECFLVEWRADDSVWYDIRGFSRPRHWLVRLGYPLARRLQRRFVRESQAAMRQAVAQR
jgi:uncharacterized protein (UPF0548 family)